MTATSPLPPGFTWVTPYTIVKDVDAALDYYQRVFGFENPTKTPGEDGITTHAEVYYQKQALMFGREGAYGKGAQSPTTSKVASPIFLYLYCEDVDQFYQQAVKAGGKSLSVPEDTFWGDRMCSLQDLDGYHWAFATYKERK